MERRRFTRLCSSLFAGAALLNNRQLATAASSRSQASSALYPTTLLLNPDETPLVYSDLQPDEVRLFNYPFVTTPCFLIRLSRQAVESTALQDSAGNAYEWHGGAGPDSALVAFSAICSHKMTHPSRVVSHINVRQAETSTSGTTGRTIIKCCSEYSIYDPHQGARVVSGPAPQPLAAIALQVDDLGQITANGCIGGTLFEPFFEKFGFRLALEHQLEKPDTLVGNTTQALTPDAYSGNQIMC